MFLVIVIVIIGTYIFIYIKKVHDSMFSWYVFSSYFQIINK